MRIKQLERDGFFRESLERKRMPKLLSIVLFAISAILLVTTVTLGILYGIERNKTKVQETILIRDHERNDLCLSPYCIEAG